jgi:hypothetical protein
MIKKNEWKFVENPPDQSSSDDDWYALAIGGYIKPDEILSDPKQIDAIYDAVDLLSSFFDAIRDAGIREEM